VVPQQYQLIEELVQDADSAEENVVQAAVPQNNHGLNQMAKELFLDSDDKNYYGKEEVLLAHMVTP
jgi:hypothetical protein